MAAIKFDLIREFKTMILSPICPYISPSSPPLFFPKAAHPESPQAAGFKFGAPPPAAGKSFIFGDRFAPRALPLHHILFILVLRFCLTPFCIFAFARSTDWWSTEAGRHHHQLR